MIGKRAFNFQDYKIRATKGLQENKSFLKYYTCNKSIFILVTRYEIDRPKYTIIIGTVTQN